VLLALPHFFRARCRFVIVAAQVQEAVDDIERQFRLEFVTVNGGLGLGDFRADHELAG
jgi:hypothetical protein